MKYISIFLVATLWFAFGCVLSSTLSVKEDYLWLAAPLAIVVSACITLAIATATWTNTKNAEKTNRTIKYLLDKFPLPENLLKDLGGAQNKLIDSSSSYAVKDTDSQDVEFHLDIYESEEKKLSPEERSAIEELSSVYELISLNIKHGYFDEKIVKQHLGNDFGIQFWIKSWPFIIYHNQIDQLYMKSKGVDMCSGIYSSYIDLMMKEKNLENKYPMYGERASERVEFKGVNKVIKLTARRRSL